MDLFKFAMEIEKDSEDYYKELYDVCKNVILKKILELLINEEIKHYNTILKMKEANAPVKMEESNILSDAKEVFKSIKSDIDLNIDKDFGALLEKAKELEKKSKAFYLKEAENSDYAMHKIILLQLVDEEEKHYFLLDNLMEFLSRPREWVEFAEFNHFDDY
jgi:rubrerythrin